MSDTPPITLVDNSRLAMFEDRPRAYYYANLRGWVPQDWQAQAPALVAGTAWHAAMDIIWREASGPLSNGDLVEHAYQDGFLPSWLEADYPDPSDMAPEIAQQLSPRLPHVFFDMLCYYVDQRRDWLRSIELLHIELPFVVPLGLTDPHGNPVLYIGRIDKVFRTPQRKLCFADHKTTTAYAGRRDTGYNFKPSWVANWHLSIQLRGYTFALTSLLGEHDVQAWVDGALVHAATQDRFHLEQINFPLAQLEAWQWRTAYWADQLMQHRTTLEALRASKEAASLPYLPVFPCGRSCERMGCAYKDLCLARTNPETWDPEAPPPLGYTERRWSPLSIDERTITAATLTEALHNEATSLPSQGETT